MRSHYYCTNEVEMELGESYAHRVQRGAKSAKRSLERGVETEKSASIAQRIAKFVSSAIKNTRYVIERTKIDLIRASLALDSPGLQSLDGL